MGTAGAVLEVHGMRAVEVLTMRDAAQVARPERPAVVLVGETEGVSVLPEAVDVRVVGKPCLQPQVLELEDQFGLGSVEQDLLCRPALDLEGERLLRVLKVQVRVMRRGLVSCRLRTSDDLLGNLVPLGRAILDEDMQSRVWRLLVLATAERLGLRQSTDRIDTRRGD